jgi:hypothetical protein
MDNFYSQQFIDALEFNTFIGTGNPNSKILIIGKEVATDTEDGKNAELEAKNLEDFNNNVNAWKKNVNQNLKQTDIPIWHFENVENNPLYAFKGARINKEGHTWRKYQKLNNFIFNKAGNSMINFQEEFFISEMSALPAKTTGKAQKNPEFKPSLIHRKETFLKSTFIQSFPVVVLACSNYIKGNEICEIFQVDFHEEIGEKTQKFWIHKNKDNSKLVIHTRNLSADVSDLLLSQISEEIKKFLQFS